MSTKFTTENENQGTTPFGVLLTSATRWYTLGLLEAMHARGFEQLTEAHLVFLAFLECGPNHPAEIARQMGVSRQAVYKLTRSLQQLGFLHLKGDPEHARQKQIVYSAEGEAMIGHAREVLLQMDEELAARIGKDDLAALYRILPKGFGNGEQT